MAGLGFSIMPLIGIRDELAFGKLKIIPIKGLPLKTTWQIAWLKNKKISPVFAAYLDYLDQHKESIISQYFNPEIPL